jgi:hypothetical protein
VAEADRKRKEAARQERATREEDRELWRAQVYAINKLMAARDAAQFAEFKKARTGWPVLQGEHRVIAGESAIERHSGDEIEACFAPPVHAARSPQKKARNPLSASLGANRSSSDDRPGKPAGSKGGDSSGLTSMSATLGNALSRTWGGPSSLASASTDAVSDADRALLKRLSRPRESDALNDALAEEAKRKGKAGTIRQQQQREEEARAAHRKAQRTEFLAREEEREITRAQIYAINKLMRVREESAFAEFRLQREAEQLGAEGGATGGERSADSGTGNGTSDGSENEYSSGDGETLHNHGKKFPSLPKPPSTVTTSSPRGSPRGSTAMRAVHSVHHSRSHSATDAAAAAF